MQKLVGLMTNDVSMSNYMNFMWLIETSESAGRASACQLKSTAYVLHFEHI